MNNKELIENLLIEYDELDMQPMLIVPDPLDRAKAWKHELMYAIAHLEAEVAREIVEFIEGKIKAMEDHTPTENLDRAIGLVNWILSGVTDELKKKYTEGKE